MDDPHLISSSTRRDVEPLLEETARPISSKTEGTTLWNVDHREEHDVTFVTLELRGITANDPPSLVLDRL